MRLMACQMRPTHESRTCDSKEHVVLLSPAMPAGICTLTFGVRWRPLFFYRRGVKGIIWKNCLWVGREVGRDLSILLMPKFIEDGWEVHISGRRGDPEQKSSSGLDVTFHSLRLENLSSSLNQNMLDSSKLDLKFRSLFAIMYDFVRAQREDLSVPPVIAARVWDSCLYSWIWPVYGLGNKIL